MNNLQRSINYLNFIYQNKANYSIEPQESFAPPEEKWTIIIDPVAPNPGLTNEGVNVPDEQVKVPDEQKDSIFLYDPEESDNKGENDRLEAPSKKKQPVRLIARMTDVQASDEYLPVADDRCIQVFEDTVEFIGEMLTLVKYTGGVGLALINAVGLGITTAASSAFACTHKGKEISQKLAQATCKRLKNLGIGLANISSSIFCKYPILIETHVFDSNHLDRLHRSCFRSLGPILHENTNLIEAPCIVHVENELIGVQVFKERAKVRIENVEKIYDFSREKK